MQINIPITEVVAEPLLSLKFTRADLKIIMSESTTTDIGKSGKIQEEKKPLRIIKPTLVK